MWFGVSFRNIFQLQNVSRSDSREFVEGSSSINHTFLLWYLEIAKKARDIVHNENFNYFIIFVICIAGINVGIQTYSEMDNVYGLIILDTCILLVFGIEIILKILSKGFAP